MNILITGGLGFIGTNLTKKLLEENHKVYIIDDISTGRHKNFAYLSKLADKNQLKVSISNITKSDFIYTCLNNFPGIDQIYHLACPASPPKYYLNPVKTLDINYIGTKNVIELSKESKARFLFTSTSEVYGDPSVSPQSEDYNGNVNPVSPRSCYDEGKRVAETLLSTEARVNNLDLRIARIFNTYGPRMDPDDGRVVTNFIKQSLTNKKITIYGTGNQTRSFCYVDDQVDGLIALMNSDLKGPTNIGNPNEISILELAEEVVKETLRPMDYEFKKIPVSDPTNRKPDISKIGSIGWKPKVDLKEGLKKTVEYMRNELAI